MKRFTFLPIFGLVFSLVFLAVPLTAKAFSTEFSQRDYIKFMVQLTGDGGMLDPNPTDDDYVKWAKKQKMDPKRVQKDWEMDASLTKELLAETLAQFFKLGKEKTGMDYVRLLLREGIALPEDDIISMEAFILMVDDAGFASRTSCIAKCKTSPSRPSKKPSKFKPPKPPKPPKVKTPKKPKVPTKKSAK